MTVSLIPTPDMSFPPRSVKPGSIGPYRLEEQIGSGGMGEVYRAYDERLHRRVAVKHVLAEESAKANVRQRFRREARTVARLNHEAIVQIYDILETDDGDWIVMELVEGATVREIMERGQLPMERALHLARQVAAGLAVAHAKGIVHRDLKIENVMVNEKESGENGAFGRAATGRAVPGRAWAGRAKILDFGLAKRIEKRDPSETTLSGAGFVVGTFRTMSPEQITEQEVDPRSDLFSFGVMLYEMTTGESPFRAENMVTTMTRVCRHQQPPAKSLDPDISDELSDFIQRLLEKDPDKRPQSALGVVRFLDGLTGETTVLPSATRLTGPASAERPTALTPTKLLTVSALDSGSQTRPARPGAARPAQVQTLVHDARTARRADSNVAIKTVVSYEASARPEVEKRLGEVEAAGLFARLEARRLELLAKFSGVDLEDGEDGILVFERPMNAILFALAYQQKAAALSDERHVPLTLTMGIHMGELVLDRAAREREPFDGDVLEQPTRHEKEEDATTNAAIAVGEMTPLVACHLRTLALPGRILFSQDVAELLHRAELDRELADQDVVWRRFGAHRLAGFNEQVEVFEVGYDTGEAEAIPTAARARLLLWTVGVVTLVTVGLLLLRGCLAS